jgi:hypothetical protein
MRRFIVSAVMALSVLTPVATVAMASPASAAPSCAFWQRDDGHTLRALCTSGAGNQYKVTATFCNQGGCVRQASSWTYYGNYAYINSGGYFAAGTITVSTRTA